MENNFQNLSPSLSLPLKEYLLPQKYPILGVGVNPVNMQVAVNGISIWISNNSKNYVCVTPAHSIMDAQNDPEFNQILNHSGMTTPDGMAVVWLLKLHGFKYVSRVYGPDLMLAVCEESIKHGWGHFFYGGAPGVAEKLIGNLQTRFPGLKVSGVYSPPYRTLTLEEDRQITESINMAHPDIVWVGISSPKQEKWMADHIDRLNAPVLIGVGAAFDFLSGNKRQAPRWIQRSGLEWLFRFTQEPTRLWRRYIQYPRFILLNICQLLGFIKYN